MYLLQITELDHLLPWGAGGEQMYHKWRRNAYINTFVKILQVNCHLLSLDASNGTDNFAVCFLKLQKYLSTGGFLTG